MSLDSQTGYIIDTEYTFNVYPEMFPRRLAYVCASQGIITRLERLNEGFDYCELGCGNGFGSNVMAAANPEGRFVAVDLNPAHIANGRRLAEVGKLTSIQFVESVFGDLLDRNDLPDFDIIALHGVYSWISERHRAEVVSFIRCKLRPGGVVYVSYNTLPGWSDLMPLRQLMVERTAGMVISSTEKVVVARNFLKEIAAFKTGCFGDGYRMAAAVPGLENQSNEYLAHEYLNADWHPQYSAEVAREMASARLSYIGDASIRPNDLSTMFPKPIQQYIESAPTVTASQTYRDYLSATRFRHDMFVKGGRKAMALDRENLYAAVRFGSLKTSEIPIAITLPGGEVSLQGVPRNLITQCRSQPMRVEEIIDLFIAQGLTAPTMWRYLELLMAIGLLEIVRGTSDRYGDFPGAEAAAKMTLSLGDFNRAVCEFAFSKMVNGSLAALVSGGVQVLSWLEAGLLLGWDKEGPDGATCWCASRILRTGNSLVSDGTKIEGMDAHVAHLSKGFDLLCLERLPMLVKTGAVILT